MNTRAVLPYLVGAAQAPTPPAIVERGKLGDTLIIGTLADKYIEHHPIERQCLRWSRIGVDIAPQTLGRAVASAIDLLSPVARAIAAQTRSPGCWRRTRRGSRCWTRTRPRGSGTGRCGAGRTRAG